VNEAGLDEGRDKLLKMAVEAYKVLDLDLHL
jgi:hypothetical protein